MKRLKAITLCLLCAIVAICFTACDDRVVVDKLIEDARYTPQTQETVTDYEYKYNFWTGDFVLVPNGEGLKAPAAWPQPPSPFLSLIYF